MTPAKITCTSGIAPDQFAIVCGVVAHCFEISREQLTAETLLREDLGVDSIDKLALALELEEEFNVVIADEALCHIRTIGETAASITSALAVCRRAGPRSDSWEYDTERRSK